MKIRTKITKILQKITKIQENSRKFRKIQENSRKFREIRKNTRKIPENPFINIKTHGKCWNWSKIPDYDEKYVKLQCFHRKSWAFWGNRRKKLSPHYSYYGSHDPIHRTIDHIVLRRCAIHKQLNRRVCELLHRGMVYSVDLDTLNISHVFHRSSYLPIHPNSTWWKNLFCFISLSWTRRNYIEKRWKRDEIEQHWKYGNDKER